jgi:hypothetical protein
MTALTNRSIGCVKPTEAAACFAQLMPQSSNFLEGADVNANRVDLQEDVQIGKNA